MDDMEARLFRGDLARGRDDETVDQLIGLFSDLQLRHQSGDAQAAWEALLLSFDFHILAPGWVRDAFRSGFSRYGTGEAADLGEAFGLVRPKGWQQATVRKRREPDAAGKTVLQRVGEALRGRKIDSKVFGEVADDLGLSEYEVRTCWCSLPKDVRKLR